MIENGVLLSRYTLENLTSGIFNYYRTHLSGVMDEWDFFSTVGYLVETLRPDVEYTSIYPEYIRRRLGMRIENVPLKEPSTGFFKPTIVYRVAKKQIASGPSFLDVYNTTKEKPFEEIYLENSVVTVYLQEYDIVTQFDLFTQGIKELQELSRWFEAVMTIYTPLFIKNGLGRIVYISSLQPIDVDYTDLHVNRISYGIRIQKLKVDTTNIINKIYVNLYENNN